MRKISILEMMALSRVLQNEKFIFGGAFLFLFGIKKKKS
jgi:hypothetical protein